MTSSTTIILPLEQFEKDYEVELKVSEGNFGKVFRARSKPRRRSPNIFSGSLIVSEDENVAVKVLNCPRAFDKLRPRHELELLQDLRHPNILRLIGAYEDADIFIQVFEFLSGGELFERFLDKEFAPKEEEINGFVKQICSGCEFLADNLVVHLDLKPDNIVFARKDSNLLKIIDFGFARRLSPDCDVIAGQGTPEFVSPEVVSCLPVSLTTDLWSVGVLTYILLSGLSPFLGDDVQETYRNIRTCNYTLEEEQFEEISFSAKDFISKLLVTDQNIRLSAEEALRHPWLVRADDPASVWSKASNNKVGASHFRQTARRLSRHRHID